MKTFFLTLFSIVSISFLLSGCLNHTVEKPPKVTPTPPADIEKETAIAQSSDFLSIYDYINPSALEDNNYSIYMKKGIPKPIGDAPFIHFLEQGEIVQLNTEMQSSFLEWLANLQLEAAHCPNYAPYLFVIKGMDEASSYFIELWPEGYIGVDWMKYYKISNSPSPQYYDNLFSKSDVVPILTYEESFEKIIPDASQKEQTTFEKNKFPTIILESGKQKYSENTPALPYLRQLWYAGYSFGKAGTYYRIPFATVYYNLDGTTFAESTIQAYHVDYITGEVTGER